MRTDPESKLREQQMPLLEAVLASVEPHTALDVGEDGPQLALGLFLCGPRHLPAPRSVRGPILIYLVWKTSYHNRATMAALGEEFWLAT